MAYLRTEKPLEAIEDCTQAIALDPLNCKAWHRRGMAYRSIGKYAEAAADYDDALR